MVITDAFKALQAGKQLANSTTWKNAQNVTNLVVTVLVGIFAVLPLLGIHIDITPEQQVNIAGGVAAVLGLFNGYVTTATSKTVGVQVGAESSPAHETARPKPAGDDLHSL